MFEIVGHFRHQRFIRHQDHGVDDIKQQIRAEIPPETHVAEPHQAITEYRGYAEQDKEFAAAKAFAQPGRTEVIGQKAHQRTDYRIQHAGSGKDQRGLNRG